MRLTHVLLLGAVAFVVFGVLSGSIIALIAAAPWVVVFVAIAFILFAFFHGGGGGSPPSNRGLRKFDL